jgi:nucleoside-diphosphate-sugar epimerase
VLTLVTGAGGFVGRAFVDYALANSSMRLRLVDRSLSEKPHPRVETIEADLAATDLASIVADVDCVVHLAAFPGGAAEADPSLSKQINLDLTQRLIEAIAGSGRSIRLVHASSIAVFGTPLPERVGDDTEPQPSMVYGKHKRLAECAVAEAADCGIDAVSLRLPGIVTRPRDGAGFKSAFMSDVFWAIVAREPYVLPVSPGATVWLMSGRACAENLLHAADCSLGSRRVFTIPALRTRVDALVSEIASVTEGSADLISYEPDRALEEQFGSLPPLATSLAESLGFKSDASLAELVRSAIPLTATAPQVASSPDRRSSWTAGTLISDGN